MSIRIISGKYKGRLVEVPPSARPTLSKSRQILFDTLESLQIDRPFGTFFQNSIVLDCFAGSGALGIEALSRGAYYAYFIDNNRTAISILRSNLIKINAINSATVISADAMTVYPFNQNHISRKCDLVFIDPPYRSNFSVLQIATHLNRCGRISDNAVLVFEISAHDIKNTKHLLQNSDNNFLEIITSKKTGNSLFIIAMNKL